MPELPEVETVRRGLEPVMAGARIERVEQRRPDLRFPFPPHFRQRLEGQTCITLGRRAKYLLAHLASGEVLVMHLGMSGRFSVAAGDGRAGAPPKPGSAGERGSAAVLVGTFTYDTGADHKHDHVVMHMAGGATITYNDPRRFGFMELIPSASLETHKLLAGLGVEPLGNELHPGYLAAKARGRSADLKAFLLDQRIIAGLGNIYVCEALFRAGLSPLRPASCLATARGAPTARCERLVPVIREVLEEAIVSGGSTLRDYARTDGTLGYFQHRFQVYGREGEPCLEPGCNGKIRRSVQSGRSTFHCVRCQR